MAASAEVAYTYAYVNNNPTNFTAPIGLLEGWYRVHPVVVRSVAGHGSILGARVSNSKTIDRLSAFAMNKIPSDFALDEFEGCTLAEHHVELRFAKHPNESDNHQGKAPTLALEAGFRLDDPNRVRSVEAGNENIGARGAHLAQLIGKKIAKIRKLEFERLELEFSSGHRITTEVFDGGESYHIMTSQGSITV